MHHETWLFSLNTASERSVFRAQLISSLLSATCEKTQTTHHSRPLQTVRRGSKIGSLCLARSTSIFSQEACQTSRYFTATTPRRRSLSCPPAWTPGGRGDSWRGCPAATVVQHRARRPETSFLSKRHVFSEAAGQAHASSRRRPDAARLISLSVRGIGVAAARALALVSSVATVALQLATTSEILTD